MQNKKEMNELYKQETGKGEVRPSLNIMLSPHQLSSILHGVGTVKGQLWLRPGLDIVLSPHRTQIFWFGVVKARWKLDV